MNLPDHPSYLLRMLQGRLQRLATKSPVLAASFGSYTHRCGRTSCRCHHGGPLHSGQHLTFKQQGKTRSVYVPKELLPEVRTGLAEHKRLKKRLHEIHQLSVALLRARAKQLKFRLLTQLGWSGVVTFKEGRTPALWREYEALRAQCPQQVVRRQWDKRVEEYRWVKQLVHEDSEGRCGTLDALECRQTSSDGTEQYFAWLTLLPVGRKTVAEIAEKGGRARWKVENEGS